MVSIYDMYMILKGRGGGKAGADIEQFAHALNTPFLSM